MKALFIILFSIIFINLFANELQWVDEQINAIKPPRSGVNKSKISTTKDPFIFLKKEDEKKEDEKTISTINPISTNTKILTNIKTPKKSTAIILDAIINKSALINGKWYKTKDKIDKYTVRSINQTTVLLKYKQKELLLSTKSKKTNIKFKNN